MKASLYAKWLFLAVAVFGFGYFFVSRFFGNILTYLTYAVLFAGLWVNDGIKLFLDPPEIRKWSDSSVSTLSLSYTRFWPGAKLRRLDDHILLAYQVNGISDKVYPVNFDVHVSQNFSSIPVAMEDWLDAEEFQPHPGLVSPDGRIRIVTRIEKTRAKLGIYWLVPGPLRWSYTTQAFETSTGRMLLSEELLTFEELPTSKNADVWEWLTPKTLLRRNADGFADVYRFYYQKPPAFKNSIEMGKKVEVSFQALDKDGNHKIDTLEFAAYFPPTLEGPFHFEVDLNGRHSARAAVLPPDRKLRIGLDASQIEASAGLTEVRVSDLLVEAKSFRRSLLAGDEVSLAGLLALDDVSFRIHGEWVAGLPGTPGGTIDGFEGEFRIDSPGGLCSWSGTVEQGAKWVPFAGQKKTQVGKASFPVEVALEPNLGFRYSEPVSINFNQLRCGARELWLKSGEGSIIVHKVDQ